MKYFFKIALIMTMMFLLVACTNDKEDKQNNAELPSGSCSENENLDHSSQSTEVENDISDTTESINKGETYWVIGYDVNFRKSPSMNGEIITKLANGSKVTKLSKEGEWLYIRYGETNGYIHSNLASWYLPYNPEKGEVSIVVKKSERLLELWQWGELINSFQIGLGRAPKGHKQVEGDGKTPEGEYYVCVRNYNSAYYLSLGVSYPNKKDAATALEDGRIDRATYERIAQAIDNGQRPDWNTALGGAIMIHGCGGSSDWTAGCIAVDNEVMDMLFDYCPIGTKITILP